MDAFIKRLPLVNLYVLVLILIITRAHFSKVMVITLAALTCISIMGILYKVRTENHHAFIAPKKFLLLTFSLAAVVFSGLYFGFIW